MKQVLLNVASIAALIAALVAAPASASAQSADATPAAKLSLARRLYDEGIDAWGKGRWSTAYDRFKASYELAPRVLTLYNLAAAQSETGRLVEAGESYRRFLRDTADGRYADQRTEASTRIELLDKQIAQVTVDVVGLEAGDLVLIDDIEFPHAALHEAIPMNPGQHVARVQRGPRVLAIRPIALSAGAAEAVQIELPTRPPDLAVHRAPDPSPVAAPASAAPGGPSGAASGASLGASLTRRADPPPERSWLRSPWLWGGVAVVVAGGATGAYLRLRGPDGVTIH
jgi:hypothetical protein